MAGICGILDFRENFSLNRMPLLQAMERRQMHRGEGPLYSLEVSNLTVLCRGGHASSFPKKGQSPLWVAMDGEPLFPHTGGESGAGTVPSPDRIQEKIAELYISKGIEFLSMLQEPFALVLWDPEKKALFLARDRLGEKPLHYHDGAGLFLFASELPPLLLHPEVPAEYDPVAIDQFLTHLFIPGCRTGYKTLRRVPPGSWMRVERGGNRIQRYWHPFPTEEWISPKEASRSLLQRIELSVQRVLYSAPVPGILLSGGVDSSLLATLAVEAFGKGVRTYSVGFQQREYDERAFARRMARFLGTEHHEWELDGGVEGILKEMVKIHGEPLGDSSLLALGFLLGKLRGRERSLLTGEGGDENFGGYRRYLALYIRGILAGLLPPFLEGFIRSLLGSPPNTAEKRGVLGQLQRLMTPPFDSPLECYRSWMRYFSPEMKENLYSGEMKERLLHERPEERGIVEEDPAKKGSSLQEAFLFDLMEYLPNDLLVKSERAFSQNGILLRAPLLDPSLLEWTLKIPPRVKLKGFRTKGLLRKVCKGRLPRWVLRRSKRGFGVPLAQWLRKELKSLAGDVLFQGSLLGKGIFHAGYIQRLWQEHQKGEKDWRFYLWALVALEMWYRTFFPMGEPSKVDRREKSDYYE